MWRTTTDLTSKDSGENKIRGDYLSEEKKVKLKLSDSEKENEAHGVFAQCEPV